MHSNVDESQNNYVKVKEVGQKRAHTLWLHLYKTSEHAYSSMMTDEWLPKDKDWRKITEPWNKETSQGCDEFVHYLDFYKNNIGFIG